MPEWLARDECNLQLHGNMQDIWMFRGTSGSSNLGAKLGALAKWITNIGGHCALACLLHKLIIDVSMDESARSSSTALALQ